MTSPSETPARIVCFCFNKTAEELRSEMRQLKIRTLEEAVRRFSAGNGCTLCRPDLEALLQTLAPPPRPG